MINKEEIRHFIDRSVLCWLATASEDGIPNVSPKEVFDFFGEDEIIIANIASPKSLQNINQNENVCVSFIDILVQKGLQIKGKAQSIKKDDPEFAERDKVLLKITRGKFPFATIFKIRIEKVKPILAPSYLLYSETTEKEQIENAKKAYGI